MNSPTSKTIPLLSICGCLSLLASLGLAQEDTNWFRFRGPDGNGVSNTAKPPVIWDGESDNLKWKTELPGKGSSSPIVWEDQIFVLTAVDTGKTPDGEAAKPAAQSAQDQPSSGRGGRGGRGGRSRRQIPTTVHDFWVLCLSRTNGDIVWKKKVNSAVPHESKHSTNTYCSASPVTNGKHVYASFGSYGLYCLDMKGNVVWQRDLGKMRTRNSFGEGASPGLFENSLVIIWDHEDQSFVEAMNATTGETTWKKNRDNASGWATPRITKYEGTTQVIVNASTVKSYDLADGKIIWECGGQTNNPIPTPMIVDDMTICMTGWRNSACYAIPLSSKGDVTGSDSIRWNSRDIGPYVPTGVLYKNQLYGSKTSSPVLSAIDIKTGETVIESSRLPEIRSMYASMVAANDHIYITGRSGKTVVLQHGPKLEVASINDLGEAVDATPALVGNQILIRGESHLFCFEDK